MPNPKAIIIRVCSLDTLVRYPYFDETYSLEISIYDK